MASNMYTVGSVVMPSSLRDPRVRVISPHPHIDDVIEVNGGSKDRVNNEPNNDATKGCHRNHIVGVDRVSNEPANAHSNNATDMVTTIP